MKAAGSIDEHYVRLISQEHFIVLRMQRLPNPLDSLEIPGQFIAVSGAGMLNNRIGEALPEMLLLKCIPQGTKFEYIQR